jgi:hypothetical protein
MALNENTLKSALVTVFNGMDSSAAGTPKTNEWYAGELAKAITDQIKTAETAAGKVIVSVSGNAAGTPNPSPIKVV